MTRTSDGVEADGAMRGPTAGLYGVRRVGSYVQNSERVWVEASRPRPVEPRNSESSSELRPDSLEAAFTQGLMILWCGNPRYFDSAIADAWLAVNKLDVNLLATS